MSRTLHWPSSALAVGQDRKYVTWLLRRLNASVPVILVGSWARGQMQPDQSDIDILVLAEDETARTLQLNTPADVQVIAVNARRFAERLKQGDDFPQWALRYGIPIRGRTKWREMRDALLPTARWPDFRLKAAQALKKKQVGETLLQMGDLPAATEEARFALSHIARALLLSRHVFPLSRPELADQLLSLGERDLAGSLVKMSDQQFLSSDAIRTSLRRVGEVAAALGIKEAIPRASSSSIS